MGVCIGRYKGELWLLSVFIFDVALEVELRDGKRKRSDNPLGYLTPLVSLMLAMNYFAVISSRRFSTKEAIFWICSSVIPPSDTEL